MRLALVLALVLRASAAFAQAPSLLYVSQPVGWPTEAGARISWAIPQTSPAPLLVVVTVDMAPPMSLAPTCDPATVQGWRWCHTMSPELKTLLDVPGLHTVTIANGTDVSASLLLRTEQSAPTTCPYTSPAGVSDPKPIGYRMGARRSVSLSNPDTDVDAFAKRVGQLEDWGWRVQWFATANSSGQITQLAMTARCVG